MLTMGNKGPARPDFGAKPVPDREIIETIRSDLLAHPAMQAWRKLQPGRSGPTKIEVLKEAKKSYVYRLGGVGPEGSAVVAKGGRRGALSVERTFYQEVLPQLPVSVLHCYGFVEGDDALDWLFVEDAGDEEYSATSEEHRRLAGNWLGLLHTFGAKLAAGANLPDRGLKRHLGHLRYGRETILRHLDNPSLGRTDLHVLKSVISQLDLLESRWSGIEKFCDGIPCTLVHGDFVHHNLRVRTTRAGPLFLPLDWETAGWGIPAVDLARRVTDHAASPDIAAYWSIVRDSRWELDLPALRKLVDLGVVFRRLDDIRWSSEKLAYSWVERPMRWLRGFDDELRDAIQAANWSG